jgi:positive regulator of sigma E activity
VRAFFDFLVSVQVMDFLTDPRVLFIAGAVFLVSLFFKWRIVAITIFAVAALVVVARYSRLAEGRTSMDQNLLVFAVGSFLVIVVVIYFLFIRGD